MDWLGVGVFIIGIALLIIAIILIKPLLRLATVIDSVKQTTDELPEIVVQNANEANKALKNVNLTLENVNQQVQAVNPLFKIVEDAGLASREVTSKWVEKSDSFKTNALKETTLTEEEKAKGFYNVLSFVFYLFRKKDVIVQESERLKN